MNKPAIGGCSLLLPHKSMDTNGRIENYELRYMNKRESSTLSCEEMNTVQHFLQESVLDCY
jgi:hypothetical protein